nr:unnamed protein product [Digitaria exilis]
MIGWGDVYKVAAAMAPLYFALALGYGSCGAINRLVIYFAFPFFGFDLTARAGSFAASYRVLAADVACKALVVLALAGWAAACRWSKRKGAYSWCITGFSLAALNNALLMGIPLLDAMYVGWAHDIAVQMSMMQIVVWFPLMLVLFEARQAWLEMPPLIPAAVEEDGHAAAAGLDSEDGEEDSGDGKMVMTGWRSFWTPLLRTVVLKLAYNPNEKFIMCGAGLAALSLVLRFVAGPAAAAAAILGLRGDLLRFAIVLVS